MRPQFNIPMDDYPELPEKIRKLCKVRGYRINDFCCRILSEGCDREIALLGGVENEKPEMALKGDVDFMFEQLEKMFNGLSGRVEALEELRSRVLGLESEFKKLGDSYDETIPPLKNSVWLLEQLKFDHLPPPVSNKVEPDGTLSQLRCEVCGQVGGHKKSGFNRQGKQLYYCGNPEHKTSQGGKYRSHKFEMVENLYASQ